MSKFLKYFLYFLSTIAILAAALTVYLVWLQPAFYFPKPTGQYAVGTKEYHWIDTNRKETYSDDPKHPNRELMVTIWYPAQGILPEKPTTPYAPYMVSYYKKNQNFFSNLIDGIFRPIYSYAQPDVTMATNVPQYPVIIFSHGYGCTRNDNTSQCEELASHGYIVTGISHTYYSEIVQFPDGRIVDGMNAEKRVAKAGANQLEINKIFEQMIAVWISDVGFVLDQFEQLARDKESMFYQRLDQTHIGIFGHSLGGATAVQICRRDARVKAGIDLEGPSSYGTNATAPFDKPFMFILSENKFEFFERPWTRDDWKKAGINSSKEEQTIKSQYFSFKQLVRIIGHDVYVFVVKDAGHMDFCDHALLKNISLFNRFLPKIMGPSDPLMSGTINGFRITQIVNAYQVNFFDKYFKNKPSELLDGNKKTYPEVETKL